MAVRYYGLKGEVKSATEYSGIAVVYDENSKTWKKTEEGYDVKMQTSFSLRGEDMETLVILENGHMLAHHVNLFDKNCYLGFNGLDTSNKVIEKFILDQSSATDYYYHFKIYDNNGMKIKSMNTQMDTLTGAIAIEIKDAMGAVVFTQRREFTKEHWPITDIICNNGTEHCFTLSHEYIKFDNHGNWIERIDRNSEMDGVSLTERKIEYYK